MSVRDASHRRTVVVLAPADPSRLPRLGDLAAYADDRLVILDERSRTDLHDRLRHLDGVDIVIDARLGNEERQWRRWLALFFHLRPGGTWVALRGKRSQGVFAAKVTDLGLDPSGKGRRLHEPALAIADVAVAEDQVTVTKQGVHLLKLRDREAAAVLADRAPALSVTELQQLKGGRLDLTGRVTSHGFEADELAAPIDYPALRLRRYDGRITLLEGAVALHGTTLLPDSYRWHLQDVPVNSRLVDVNAHWARTRRPEPVGAHLEGSYYYFDYKNPGHYGHLMTEAVSRLWGWPTAKAADPDLKMLVRRSPRESRSHRPRPELTLLPAFGIDVGDLVWVDESVTVDHLVGLTPMWHNKAPYSAHPGIRAVWSRLRDGLPGVDVPERPRIFVTRRDGNRHCHNTAEVEDFFRGHGFHIIEPGGMSIPDQAATFARARVVAGFGGTGMFNLAFARDLEQVIVLNHTAYDARNEHLMAAVLGADTHYFWSEPDIPHPQDGWAYEAFQSPWTFDLGHHRSALEELLA
jgi:capsular polysaccharide biosynthesis protein